MPWPAGFALILPLAHAIVMGTISATVAMGSPHLIAFCWFVRSDENDFSECGLAFRDISMTRLLTRSSLHPFGNLASRTAMQSENKGTTVQPNICQNRERVDHPRVNMKPRVCFEDEETEVPVLETCSINTLSLVHWHCWSIGTFADHKPWCRCPRSSPSQAARKRCPKCRRSSKRWCQLQAPVALESLPLQFQTGPVVNSNTVVLGFNACLWNPKMHDERASNTTGAKLMNAKHSQNVEQHSLLE